MRPKLSIYILAFVLSGCASTTEYYESKITEESRSAMEQVLAGNVHIEVVPENHKIISSVDSVLSVPATVAGEQRFDSNYYKKAFGDYSKPINGVPSYFIVTMNLYPEKGDFTAKVSALRIILGDGARISPDRWDLSNDWWGSWRKEESFEYGKHLLKCREVPNSYMQTVTDDVVTVSRGTPACIILRYPISPIHPSDKFWFEINATTIGNRSIPIISLGFEGVKKQVTSSFSYRIGP